MTRPSAGEMMDPPTPSTMMPSTNILSLPHEVLSLVISHCDKPASLALIYAHPHFSSINIDQHLWRDLRLAVSDTAADIRSAEHASGPRLATKVKATLDRANSRRVGMVRSIAMMPLPEAMRDLLQLLALAAPTVEAMTILTPPPHHQPDGGVLNALDSAFKSLTTFPFLRCVTLDEAATRSFPFVTYLLSLAPRLDTLVIDISASQGTEQAAVPSSPPDRRLYRQIHNLRIIRRCDYQEDPLSIIQSFEALLDSLPHVRRLSIDYPLQISDPTLEDTNALSQRTQLEEGRLDAAVALVRRLGRLEHVEDLDWRATNFVHFFGFMDWHDPFNKLQRLVLDFSDWKLSFGFMRALPNITAIFFNDVSGWALDGLPSASPQPFDDFLSRALRGCPKLSLLHFLGPHTLEPGLDIFPQLDQIQATSTSNGRITSLHHGDDNLLHATLLIEAPSTLQTFTEYKGKAVPLDVLERMRVVDGKSEEEWRGRGVEVGDEAWEVLLAWEREAA